MALQRLVGYGNPITDRPAANTVPGMQWVDSYGRVTFSDGAAWVDKLYDDWRWAGQARTGGGGTNAIMTQIGVSGVYGWVFTDQQELLFTDLQLPHDYKEGTDIIPHIHWMPTTTGTYTGSWTLDIMDWVDAATGTAMAGKQTFTSAISGAKTQYQMQSANFSTNLPGTNRKISSILHAKLKLTLTVGVGCLLGGLDGHYQVDANGSLGVTGKNG